MVANIASCISCWADDTITRLCHILVETKAFSHTKTVFGVTVGAEEGRSSSSHGPGRCLPHLLAEHGGQLAFFIKYR